MIYDAIDIAKYVIGYASKNYIHVSRLRLKEILYYLQVYFILDKNEPCFRDTMVAVADGINIPSIADMLNYRKPSFKSDNIDNLVILYEDRERIDRLVKGLNDIDNRELLDSIHNSDLWAESYESESKIISVDAIKQYYKKEGLYRYA